jgi:hypothetical protein
MYWGILQKQETSLVSLQEVEESQVERHLGKTSGHDVPGKGLVGGGPDALLVGAAGAELGVDTVGGVWYGGD